MQVCAAVRPLRIPSLLALVVAIGCTDGAVSPSGTLGVDEGLPIVRADVTSSERLVRGSFGSPRNGAQTVAQLGLSDFAIDDFSSATGLQLVGSAHVVGTVLRLTDAVQFTGGAAWALAKPRLANGFETSFAFRVDQDGSDGIAFVIQDNAPDVLGGIGAGLGYEGLPRSLAVEVDLWDNLGFPDVHGGNHIAVQSRGVEPNEAVSEPLAFATPAADLSDGQVHTLRIQYAPGALSAFLDGAQAPLFTAAVDLTNIRGASILDDAGRAWVGITAATGVGVEAHDLINWAFSAPEPAGTAPVIDQLQAIVIPPGVVPGLSGVWLRVRLTDPGDPGPWNWRIDWGDGVVTTPTVAIQGAFAFLRAEPYSTPGPHAITVTATDPSGLASAPVTTTVP